MYITVNHLTVTKIIRLRARTEILYCTVYSYTRARSWLLGLGRSHQQEWPNHGPWAREGEEVRLLNFLSLKSLPLPLRRSASSGQILFNYHAFHLLSASCLFAWGCWRSRAALKVTARFLSICSSAAGEPSYCYLHISMAARIAFGS